MEIKRVTIGSLDSPIKTGVLEQGKSIYRLYRVPESISTKICLISGNNAIDLDSLNKSYPILKRDSFGRLENQEIEKNKLYALDFEDLGPKEAKIYTKKVKEYKKINH